MNRCRKLLLVLDGNWQCSRHIKVCWATHSARGSVLAVAVGFAIACQLCRSCLFLHSSFCIMMSVCWVSYRKNTSIETAGKLLSEWLWGFCQFHSCWFPRALCTMPATLCYVFAPFRKVVRLCQSLCMSTVCALAWNFAFVSEEPVFLVAAVRNTFQPGNS